jgi:hypothetical protein
VAEPLGDVVGLPEHSPLEMAAAARRIANAAEISALLHTLDWATDHGTDCEDDAAAGDRMHPIPLAGEGTPFVREDAIPELATTLGLSDTAARQWIGDALELAHRLPRILARLFDQQLPLWKARMVAQASRNLTVAGAAWLDAELADTLEKVGPVVLQRLIATAIDRFDPELAEQRAAEAAEERGVELYRDDLRPGTVEVVATLDAADAADIHTAVQQAAADLKSAGSEESLDVRRSQALGVIARHYLGAGDTPADTDTDTDTGTPRGRGAAATRVVNLYVHLTPGEESATVERAGLATIEQVRTWCTASHTRVTVRPVIDLASNLRRTGYVPSEQMREQAILTDVTCVAPHCTRSARTADLDHIEPYDRDHPGRGGPTESANLASLCRYHHRVKTFTAWSYAKLEPGYYLWRSPLGAHYLRTPQGTVALS